MRIDRWAVRSLVSIRGSGEPLGGFGAGRGTPDFF